MCAGQVKQQIRISNVAALAHLGVAAVGVLAWPLWRVTSQR
jgi:hypothetical protein